MNFKSSFADYKFNSNHFLIYTSLFIAAFIIRFWMINASPFLYMWDEQYHALVAKNMMLHPLKPMLYLNPVLPYEFKNWSANHIWIHKQPLFLWQSAFSMKLFGANEIAFRLPSAFLSAIVVVVIYRMVLLITNPVTAFISSVLIMTNQFHLLQVSGAMGMDHNDVSFMAYVSLSIWAWVEYEINKKRHWIFLIGLFVGCAVLCKWLPGLIVFAGWGISSLFVKKHFLKENEWKKIATAFLISVLIFLPWQFFTLYYYPIEAQWEHAYNTKHLFEVVEGHGGDFWYHFNHLYEIYNHLHWFIIPGMIAFYFQAKQKHIAIAFISMAVFVYLFFSIAATKILPFTIMVLPLNLIFVAALFSSIISLIKIWQNGFVKPWFVSSRTTTKVLMYSLLAILFLLLLNNNFNLKLYQDQILPTSTHYGGLLHYGEMETLHTKRYKKLAKELAADYVIVNCPDWEYAACMFYSGKPTYLWVDDETILKIKHKGYRVATFADRSNNWQLADSSIFKIYWDK